MEKVDHIGIAVRNLDERISYYTDTLGLKLLKVEEVESQKVRVEIGRASCRERV